MTRWACITTSTIHLLALAISTYLASLRIESILVTGAVCSLTGIVAGACSFAAKRPLLAAASLLTPSLAVLLFLLENGVLEWGPVRAARPFCIVFVINQVIATLTMLVQLNILLDPVRARSKQITLRTLMLAMVSFSVFFAIARHLLQRQHDGLMALALGLLGITFVGLSTSLFNAVAPRKANSKPEC